MTSSDYAEYERKAAAAARLAAEMRPLNKTALFDALAAAGIDRVSVAFDGCGDSGQIESVTAIAADGSEITLPATTIAMREVNFDGPSVRTEQRDIAEAIETISYAYLEETHDGWENDDGACGEFVFGVADRTIRLDYTERYTATNFLVHVF